MQITVHRGTHQIGGCVTEIKTASARIIIDMGAELPRSDKKESRELKIEGVTFGKADCDGVFITHYHGDHVGMVDKVLPEIPIYMGKVAKEMYVAFQNLLKASSNKGNPEVAANFKTFVAGKAIIIKYIKITPYTIDHSAFDAYMFLIEAEGKRVLHTGDFRMHGARGRKMPLVFEKYASDIDVLITEGTMMSRTGEKVMTEHELGRKAKEIMRENKNVFVLASSMNIDTIAEFYGAAIESGKTFVVLDEYQKKQLEIVTKNSKSSFYDFERRAVYTYGKNLHPYMQKNGFCFLIRAGRSAQKAVEAFPDSALVYSMWEGYLDQNRAAYDKNKYEFVENAKKLGSRYIPLHTSGHATAEQIKTVCDVTNAKIIIPVHSEKPEAFKALGVSGEVCVLQDGESFTV